MHQTIKGITIMNEQLLATGTDRTYAAALDWIRQAAASGKTLPLPGDEGPAQEDPVAALLPVITSEHATAIVAQQIRQTLSAPWPAPRRGLRPLITARSGTPTPTRPGVPTATAQTAASALAAGSAGLGILTYMRRPASRLPRTLPAGMKKT